MHSCQQYILWVLHDRWILEHIFLDFSNILMAFYIISYSGNHRLWIVSEILSRLGKLHWHGWILCRKLLKFWETCFENHRSFISGVWICADGFRNWGNRWKKPRYKMKFLIWGEGFPKNWVKSPHEEKLFIVWRLLE